MEEVQEKTSDARPGEGGETPAAPQAAAEEENLLEAVKAEYPDAVRGGRLTLPAQAETLRQAGVDPLSALRLAEVQNSRAELERLRGELAAERANRANAAASTGSVAGGDACEKDYYSSREWDRLPAVQKDKFIRSGKVFDFMKKWRDRT